MKTCSFPAPERGGHPKTPRLMWAVPSQSCLPLWLPAAQSPVHPASVYPPEEWAQRNQQLLGATRVSLCGHLALCQLWGQGAGSREQGLPRGVHSLLRKACCPAPLASHRRLFLFISCLEASARLGASSWWPGKGDNPAGSGSSRTGRAWHHRLRGART